MSNRVSGKARNIYKLYFGKIPKGFHVHHIDSDPSNDDIMNLIALDKYTHEKYHFYKSKLENQQNTILFSLFSIHYCSDQLTKDVIEMNEITRIIQARYSERYSNACFMNKVRENKINIF